MDNQVISMREVQRHYRELVNRVKQTKQPIYLGARQAKEAVLLDIETFENLRGRAQGQKITWKEMKARLDWIRKGSKRGGDSAKFIHEDRQRH